MTPARLAGLDVAAQILVEADKPLSAGQIVETALAAGLWTTSGKTPAATICAAMLREIAVRGEGSRFRKVGRGAVRCQRLTSPSRPWTKRINSGTLLSWCPSLRSR